MSDAKTLAHPTPTPVTQTPQAKPETAAAADKPEPAAIPVTMDYQQGFTSGR